MTTEDYVNKELMPLLLEKGCFLDKVFVQDFRPIWYIKGSNDPTWWCIKSSNDPTLQDCDAYYIPTQSQVMKWLREKGFHIFVPIEIDYDEDERGKKWYHQPAYYPEILRVSDGKSMYDDGSLYAEPKQAIDVAIKYCLENLI